MECNFGSHDITHTVFVARNNIKFEWNNFGCLLCVFELHCRFLVKINRSIRLWKENYVISNEMSISDTAKWFINRLKTQTRLICEWRNSCLVRNRKIARNSIDSKYIGDNTDSMINIKWAPQSNQNQSVFFLCCCCFASADIWPIKLEYTIEKSKKK